MANFVSISGPSTTGKTSLMNSLSTYSELSSVVFSPDMHDVVWSNLVDGGYFTDFTEILKDTDYLCTYILRLIDYYNNYIDSYKDSDCLVILDGCWLDLSIYSILNMWYTRGVKSVQEDILEKVSVYNKNISRIYITEANDSQYPLSKYHIRGKMSTFRTNRPLEIQYYELAKNFKNSESLPSTDVSDCSLFIINDLKKLGYV